MTVAQLKAILADVPDEMPVEALSLLHGVVSLKFDAYGIGDAYRNPDKKVFYLHAFEERRMPRTHRKRTQQPAP